MIGCALLGMIIERLVYRPLRGSATLNVLITAIGVSLLLEYFRPSLLRRHPRTFPDIFPAINFEFGSLVISSNQILVIAVAALLMVALQLIVYRTKIGTAMRAVSLNPRPPNCLSA